MESGTSIELPRFFRASGYLDDLSFNAQVYVMCPSCSFEERASPVHLLMVSQERLLATPCPSCDHSSRVLVHHRENVDVRCVDCGHSTRLEVLPWVVVRCPHCLSRRLQEANSAIEPPLPPVFGELGERLTLHKGPHELKEHPWGVIGPEDAERITEEVIGDEPDAHLYWFVAGMFVRSLITFGGYSKPEDYFWLLNAQGNFSHIYFKLTGDLVIGISAVENFEEAVRLAPDDMNRASTEHNVAIGINSILVRYRESIERVEEMWGRSNLRDAALAAAARAMAVYEEQAKKQPATLPPQDSSAGKLTFIGPAQQVARVHHLMGDLLSVPPTDDARRRKAIEHYTAALKTPLTPQLTAGLRQSRCSILVSLEHPTENEIRLAEAELRQMTQ